MYRNPCGPPSCVVGLLGFAPPGCYYTHRRQPRFLFATEYGPTVHFPPPVKPRSCLEDVCTYSLCVSGSALALSPFLLKHFGFFAKKMCFFR